MKFLYLFADSPRGQKSATSGLIVPEEKEYKHKLYNNKQVTPIKHEDIERTLLEEAQKQYPALTVAQFLDSNDPNIVPPNVSLEAPKKTREQAKISPYNVSMARQDQFTSVMNDRNRMLHSPKVEVKLPPLEVEINQAALQGKLAYVSPTVRTIHNPTHKLATSTAGAIINSTSAFQQHKQRPPNLNFSTRPPGPSQLSPVQTGMQLAQPVFLNTGPQMDMHR